MSIILKQISYIHPDREPLFRNISFTLNEGDKVALIGHNGSGKSTLLRILSGELKPSEGEIVYTEQPYYIPQHFGQYDNCSVAEALHVDKKLGALHRILSGDASGQNFSLLGDDWGVEERSKEALSRWGLSHITLGHDMKSLSGGEKTKVFLSGIYIHQPSVILMDEPSNHLDVDSRMQLYDLIGSSRASIILVSHDRTLLNTLNLIYELNAKGVEVYGGNYEFYKEQKQEKMEALQARYDDRQKELRKARQIAREVAERKQKKDVRGKKSVASKGIPRIMLNTIRNRAEASGSKLKDVHEEKMEGIVEDMKRIRRELPEKRDLKLSMDNMELHIGKILVTAENINFGYSGQYLWEAPISFQIRSGDRIVISGRNGSGKTTLLKLLFGELAPDEGKLTRADFKYLYIDQDYSVIDNSLTVFEQVQHFNARHLSDDELRVLLHRFLFTYDVWNKGCDRLSGGEKMRLIFCCMLVSDNAPDMFVLDEPTNNLDIQSLEVVTTSIKDYMGTLLVVSHDMYFIEEVGIIKAINLS